MRWFQKTASKVNGSLWINGCVNFNRDFTIQNPIASRFHCETIVLKKVFNNKLYNIKSTKSIFVHPVHVYMSHIMCESHTSAVLLETLMLK